MSLNHVFCDKLITNALVLSIDMLSDLYI